MNTKNQLTILLLLILVILSLLYFKSKKDQIILKGEDKVETELQSPLNYDLKEPEVIRIEPKFENYPPVRKADSSLGKVLSDIDSHMPAGHIYKDSDRITWGHETSHGIASNLRQKFSSSSFSEFLWGAKRINGFYCLENKAVIIEEPKTTIQRAASYVPKSLRGPVFNLYLVQQAQSWGDTPLYIFDEWMGYTNGSHVRKDLGIQERAETVSQMLEFDVYSIALAMAVKKDDPSYDDTQFKSFLMWNIEQSFQLYKGDAPAEARAGSYLEILRSGGEAENLRKFAQDYFGANWTQNIMGF